MPSCPMPGGGRCNRATWRKRRRLTRRLGSRHGARAREVRRVRAPPVPGVAGGDAVERRLQNCPWITMATIRKLLILVKRDFGSKPIWLTEYGYQTNPPDTFLGVPLKRQATMLSLAAMRAWRLPRVTMFFQYLYRDEPS